MIGLLQRVAHAGVTVEGEDTRRGDGQGAGSGVTSEVASEVVARIGPGLLVLVGVEQGDDEATARRLLDKLLHYRVFPDADGRMNRSLADAGGGLLLVPQFTLAADTRKGTRPSFSSAAAPAEGKHLFDTLVALARAAHPEVATGVFGAHMQVALVNDGPVTFWLRVPPPA